MKEKVLFICTHNSVRSQMAEGFLRTLYGERYEAYSAGTEPTDVNPYAVKVMAEVGIDISSQRSKSIDELKGIKFDYIVTVCDRARESCILPPGGGRHIHKEFDDPSRFKGTEEEILNRFRALRDQIRSWIEERFGEGEVEA